MLSNSIKSVAPALCPGFDYADLEGVADGGAASAAFLQLASGYLKVPAEVDHLRAELLAYCQRYPCHGGGASGTDTLGTSLMAKKVEIEPVPPEPRLGLFWFIATDRNPSRFASLSRPFSEVSEIEGFKTLDEGHVDVWSTLQRVDPTLLPYEYEYFPRGRVNWRKDDDRSILVLDPKLNCSPFITYILIAWKIPPNRLLVLSDAHYRSVARVGPPQQGKGAE